ncbi:MAG: hypothetical protein ACTHJJ_02010 [Intrasporangium sp.]|uniref:hypothetical protein n=1 Tax=Intrasporangium sp. TaxID=1925024 RepID=UPI003F7E9C75
MGGRGFAAGLCVGVLGLGGCTVPSIAPGSTPVPGGPLGVATTLTETGPGGGTPGADQPIVDATGPTFPLTFRRTGGIAGFHDTVVINANGTLSVDTDTIHGRICNLDKGRRNGLLVALSTLRLGAPALTPTQLPDSTDTSSNPITITVTDVHHHPVDLDDPSLGEIRSTVTALVADVTLTVPATTRCETPST